MPAKLIVIAGPDEGLVYPLEADEKVTIGRGEAASLRLADLTISRAHCIVEYESGIAIVKDNASKSGTRVNTKGIEEHLLRADDIISVGTTKIRFQAIVKQPPTDWNKEPPAIDPDDLDSLKKLSGTRLAHFDIGPVVAVGGSGVVFQGTDIKDKREIALKVYVSEFAKNDEDLQRFIRAVKTMLPMRHSNLVTLYGGGKTGPYCWMSMEYVDGESLKDTIDRIGQKGKMDWRPALRVALDICRGLHYIHGEKIIHRNLSPTNILFSRLGVVKLGSLILAKALSGALARDVTVAGNLLGDIYYLAPEQVGAGGAVDARADLYSLGTLFYTLLTGNTPFKGSNPIETASWIIQRAPKPPRKINPEIPELLENSVLKLLAKRPADRFQTAAELMIDLEQMSPA